MTTHASPWRPRGGIALLAATVLLALVALGTPAASAANTDATASSARPTADAAIERQGKRKLRKLYDYHLSAKKCRRGAMDHCTLVDVKASPRQAWRVLQRCFSCTFPIKGAPRRFPRNGQYIALKACAARFFCKNAPVRFYNHRGASFSLVAQRGHFDGAGSKIFFRWYRNRSGHLKLHVWAYVANPSVPDWANKALAYEAWLGFAHRMGERVG